MGLLKAQPGERPFRDKNKEGEERCLTADDVDMALRRRFAETASAKNFRTFRASSIVAGALQSVGKDEEKCVRRRSSSR
ncbi:MAG: hypothetical protein ABL956_03975 [Hyphomonadaceae bacterium]